MTPPRETLEELIRRVARETASSVIDELRHIHTEMNCACAKEKPSNSRSAISERLYRLADEIHFDVDEIMSSYRGKSVVAQRHAAWRALRSEGYSLVEIARCFGMNHTSVLCALRKGQVHGEK